MADESSLTLKVMSLEKSMETIVKVMKEIRTSVKLLEDKIVADHDEEIKGIRKKQDMIDSILVENTEAIKRIDSEIQKYQLEKKEDSEADSIRGTEIKSHKRCRYFNRGHCRNKSECRFAHPSQSCSKYLEEGKCEGQSCAYRHPKICKWMKARNGCRRHNCDYLHVTHAVDDGKDNEAHKTYPCIGCKNVYEDKVCVVQHIVHNVGFFLCLNCDGWIQRKNEIILPGWSLFDENGDLKQNV